MKRYVALCGAAVLWAMGIPPAAAGCLTVNGAPFAAAGLPFCLSVSDPLSLPLLTSAQAASMFTFLGSFALPNSGVNQGVGWNSGALSVNGGTLMIPGLMYNPLNDLQYVDGLGSATIPALTGTPGYTGANGTATITNIPLRPNYSAAANYTLTAAPATGATSATFTVFPTGLAANAGWEIKFSDGELEQITGVSGNTVSWATALTGSGITTAVQVAQYDPIFPWGNSAGDVITGTYDNNGALYITGACDYDATGTCNLGWVVQGTVATPGAGWGAVNTMAGQTPEYSRRLSGPINQIPAIWQQYFSGPLYESTSWAAGANGPSVIESAQPIGFNFNAFNGNNITTAGAAVPVQSALDYFYQGLETASYPEQLAGRSLSGPFPTCTQAETCGTGYPATLTAAPAAGATSATVTLPTGTVTATANVTTNSDIIDITAFTSGTLSNSGICYTVTDSAGALGGGDNFICPAFDYSPGATLTTGNYIFEELAGASATGDTLTMTPDSYSGYWMVTFSDGERRIVSLSAGSGVMPNPPSGTVNPTEFAVQGTNAAGEPVLVNSPLTGSGITTSVTMSPMGDNFASMYDGPFGTGFIVPNTSTYAVISLHQYGPGMGRSSGNCYGGSSGSNELPIYPDTANYVRIQISLYKMSDLVAAAQGTQPVYQATPYAFLTFPDQANILASQSGGCIRPATNGWVTYDYATNVMYMQLGTTVLEYQITPP